MHACVFPEANYEGLHMHLHRLHEGVFKSAPPNAQGAADGPGARGTRMHMRSAAQRRSLTNVYAAVRVTERMLRRFT